MPKESPEFEYTPIATVRLAPIHSVHLDWVPGSQTPVKLSLIMQDHLSLERVLEIHPRGAILEIHMGKEAAIGIYQQIRRLAQTMDWSLPQEDESQAGAHSTEG